MPHSIIFGVGAGLSASLARKLAARGHSLTLAARGIDKLGDLAAETGGQLAACDASDPDQVEAVFDASPGDLSVVIYNPSYRLRGPVAELEPRKVRKALEVTAFGAFLAGRLAATRMAAQTPDQNGVRGTILFTGASAGVKGFPQSAPFAMGKFAQRGLAQSMARELHPKGIHVAWINIDGGIRSDRRPPDPDAPNALLEPDVIADEYLRLIDQHPSAWSDELTLRPWVETF